MSDVYGYIGGVKCVEEHSITNLLMMSIGKNLLTLYSDSLLTIKFINRKNFKYFYVIFTVQKEYV